MDRELVVKLAQEAGAHEKHEVYYLLPEELERFAALVAAHEREACAKVCETRVMGDNNREDEEAKRCAAAIRSRT